MKKPHRPANRGRTAPTVADRLRGNLSAAIADTVKALQGMPVADALRVAREMADAPAPVSPARALADTGALLADMAAGDRLARALPPAYRFPPLLTPEGATGRDMEPTLTAWKLAGSVMAAPAVELVRSLGTADNRRRMGEALAVHTACVRRELARAEAAEARARALVGFAELAEAPSRDAAAIERVAASFAAVWGEGLHAGAVPTVTPAGPLSVGGFYLPAEGQPWGACWAALPPDAQLRVGHAAAALVQSGAEPADPFPLDDPGAWPRFADGVKPVPVHIETPEGRGWAMPMPAGGWLFVAAGLVADAPTDDRSA